MSGFWAALAWFLCAVGFVAHLDGDDGFAAYAVAMGCFFMLWRDSGRIDNAMDAARAAGGE